MKRPHVTGWVATCRCGVTVGAIDRERSLSADTSRILGRWLADGCTIEPRFTGSWRATIEPCRCPADEQP